jgi:predicted  nucleic acid-binding Zn-ribbon protein
MSEIKNFIVGIILFIIWSASCFFGGYIFCDKRATKQLEQANNELREQQLKYDELIRTSETRIRESEDRIRATNQQLSDIREQLFGKVSDNGSTITELSTIIEQIKKQRISL